MKQDRTTRGKLLRALVAVIFFITALCAEEGDSLQLRIFPELNSYYFGNIAALNEDFAIAYDNKMFRWDGKEWAEFPPPVSSQDLKIIAVKIIAPDNIWVFYTPHPEIYQTRISHFNGRQWRKIGNPQPFYFYQPYFLDDHSFIAAGGWGSLVYCDGRQTRNLPNIQSPSAQVVWAKSPQHFIITAITDEYGSRSFLYEFKNGRWAQKFGELINTDYLRFYTPDSALFMRKNVIMLYHRGAVVPLDTIQAMTDFNEYSSWGDAIFFQSRGALYRHAGGKTERVARLGLSSVSIVPLNRRAFFLRQEGGKIFYLGRRKVGRPVTVDPWGFRRGLFLSFGASGHISVALYKNHHARTDIYFTSSNQQNDFLTAEKQQITADPLAYKDVAAERGLVGNGLGLFKDKLTWDGGVFFADIDNDGDDDAIFASLLGKTLLYENRGDDVFRDLTDAANFFLVGRICNISWRDFNGDGNLDFAAGDETGALKIYTGDGFFHFKEIPWRSGAGGDSLDGYLPSAADIDNDGDADLLAYGNYGPARLFKNRLKENGDGKMQFEDAGASSPELTASFDFYTQSVAWGDYDNDGDIDLFLANRRSPCKLFKNDGQGNFSDVSAAAGFNQRFLAYGANWGDLNSDGFLDLFLTTLGKNYIYWSRGGKRFDIDSLSILSNPREYSTGSALTDINDDGSLDILVANSRIGRSSVFYNPQKSNNFIELSLRNPARNRNGLGGLVWLYRAGGIGKVEELVGFRQIFRETGYNSGTLPAARFDVEESQLYDAVAQFPSGRREVLRGIAGGKRVIRATGEWFPVFYLRIEALWRHPGKRPFAIRALGYIWAGLLLMGFIYRFLVWKSSYYVAYISVLAAALYLTAAALNRDLLSWQLLGGFIFLGGLLIIVFQRIQIIRRRDVDPFPLFDALRQFRHGKTGLTQIEHLAALCRNMVSPKLRVSLWERLRKEAAMLHKDTAPALRDVRRMAREVDAPLLLIGDVYHRCRKTIRCARRFASGGSLPGRSRLKRGANLFRKLEDSLVELQLAAENLISCNLVDALNAGLYRCNGFNNVIRHYPPAMVRTRVVIQRRALTEVFANLFENSLQAMPGQACKELTIRFDASGVGEIIARIEDNGPGIPPEIAGKIFEKGYSTKNSSGRGLADAVTLLKKFGGNIQHLKTAAGRGAAFKIMLKVVENA